MKINKIETKRNMQIFIKTLTGKTLEVELEPTDTIGDIKDEIFKKYEYMQWQQTLIAEGKWLIDDEIIWYCKSPKESWIMLVLWLSRFRELNITFNPKTKLKDIKLRVSIFDLIEDIKFKIQDITGFPLESIKLFSKGYEIIDSKSVIEVGFTVRWTINASIII